MKLNTKAISTLLCGLLVFTGAFCVCNPVSAAIDNPPEDADHHAHHENASMPDNCGGNPCPDCGPDALGQTSSYELKASHSIKLDPSTPDADLIFMAPGPEPPSVIALVNPQAPPPPHVADTPVRRWDLLLE